MKTPALSLLIAVSLFAGGAFATDTDGDGLTDELEISVGMDPNDATDFFNDTDGDGVYDGEEAGDGTDLNDAESFIEMIDRAVGTDGFVTFAFSEGGLYEEMYPRHMAQDASGSLFFSAELDGDESSFALVKLDEHWDMDSTFSDDGYTTGVDLGVSGYYVRHFQLTDQGQIKLAVNQCNSWECLMVVTSQGQLDTTEFSTQTQPGVYDYTRYMSSDFRVYQETSGAFYTGYTVMGANASVRLFKVGADAVVDETFNNNTGALSFNLLSGNSGEYVTGIVPAHDGDYLLTVRANAAYERAVFIIKFSAEGILDANWGTEGILRLPGASDFRDLVLSVNEDGGYWAYVTMGSSSNQGVAVLKLNSDGTTDTAFGTEGQVSFYNPTGAYYYLTDLLQMDDGKLLVVSAMGRGADASGLMMARLLDSGELDTSFYGNGVMQVSLGDNFNIVSKAMLLQNGNVAIAGSQSNTITGAIDGVLFSVLNPVQTDDGNETENETDTDNESSNTEPTNTDASGDGQDEQTEENEVTVTFGGSLPLGMMSLFFVLLWVGRARTRAFAR